MNTFLTVLFGLIFLYLIRATIIYWTGRRNFADFPAKIVQWFDVFDVFVQAKLIPRWLAPTQRIDFWEKNWNLYEKFKSGVLVTVSSRKTRVFVADPDVLHQIMVTKRQDFLKPVKQYVVVSLFGNNLVASEGEMWKRHRKAAAPSFTEKNNRLVCDATAKICCDMFDHWEKSPFSNDKKTYQTNVAHDMNKLTLSVISSAGFGTHFEFEEKPLINSKHSFSFQQCIQTILKYRLLYVLFLSMLSMPRWIFRKIPIPPFSKIGKAFREFEMYLDEMLEEQSKSEESNSLLTNLVKASSTEEDRKLLSTEELYGNMFIFIIAGHETTAGALTYALILLATHQNIQEKLYQHVRSVIGDHLPQYEDFPRLTYVQSILKETLRLFPPVTTIPKMNPKPTTLEIPNGKYSSGDPKPTTLHLPANTLIHVDIASSHRNPKSWVKPNDFIPERFELESEIQSEIVDPLKTGNVTQPFLPQSWLPFSDGIRSCIGRKFSEIEFACAISCIIQRYSIHLPANTTFEQMIDSDSGITLRPKRPALLDFRLRA